MMDESSKRSDDEVCDIHVRMVDLWLSLEKCIGRTVSQWEALRSYFNRNKDCERPGKVNRCAEAYADIMVKLLLYFLQYSLTRLNRFNVLFQSEGYRVLELESAARELIKVYLLNFVRQR